MAEPLDISTLPTASLTPPKITTISPGLPPVLPDSFLAHQNATWQLYQEERHLNEELEREIETLRQELAALRAGTGITIVIEGRPFPLLEHPNGHQTRPVNPLTDSFLLEK